MPKVMSNALIKDAVNIANGDVGKVANIIDGANGIGFRHATVDSLTPLTLTPIVPIVTHAPTLFKHVTYMDKIWKSLVERHLRSLTGIDFGYTLETASQGGQQNDGQELAIPTKTKRSAVTPSFVWPEVQGMMVYNFIKTWISIINDPDTNGSLLSSRLNDGEFDPMLYSSFSSSICLIQFDPTFHPSNIIAGYMLNCVFPTETGMVQISNERGTVTAPVERTIPFSAIIQDSTKTFEAAQAIAETLALHRADFRNAVSVADAIDERLQGNGVEQEISEIVAETT